MGMDGMGMISWECFIMIMMEWEWYRMGMIIYRMGMIGNGNGWNGNDIMEMFHNDSIVMGMLHNESEYIYNGNDT
jgi:hypothetical protein